MQWITLFAGLLVCPITSAINITFTMQPGDLQVQEGNAFRLSCNISVEGDADNITSHLYWEKDGEFFRNGSEFVVSSAEDIHSGVYACVVRVENGEERRSRNVTVTVNTSDDHEDLVPLIAMIVCVTGVTLIFTLLSFTIGVYMCFCHSGGNLSVGRDKTCWRQSHQQTDREQNMIPSTAPRKFSNGLRSKSKSLSQLLHSSAEEFPLDVTLHKSSSDVLSGSQPTQTTDIEDPSALDFDLALDERMFEHEAPQKPHSSNDRAERKCSNEKTAIRGKWEGERSKSERRASEGQLVFPEAMETSRKSILKESKSFNDGLHNQRRSSAVSDMSSDITQSDENSLHLGKSVRFNMSGDDLAAADSGVHTGTSTPHSIPVGRRASEPETLSYQFSNSERRGSAPGDLVSEIGSTAAGWESGEHMYNQDRLDIEDEGMATGSEEWSQNEKSPSFEETQAKRQFESGFSQLDKEDETDTLTSPNVKPDHESPLPGIATRVARLLSASQKHTTGNFVRGPSTLTRSSHTAVASKLKVSEIKERYLQESRGRIEETSPTGKEEGRKMSISKLVQERSELFKEKQLNDKENPTRSHKPLQDRQSDGHQTEGAEQSANTQPDSSLESNHNHESTPQASNDESFSSGPPINIPIFSAPSGLSNWVPACLRGTVVSPYSYDGEQASDDSEFEDDDTLVMEPLEPTIGRDMVRARSTTPFAGVASFSPIGRSWLSSGKPSGPAIFPLVNTPKTPGASEKSPFNESISLQRGHTPRSGAVNRLSVIPEETASACGSATDIGYLH